MTNDSEFINHRTNQHEWTADFIAGWVSGAVSILACQPVDTILTRWQAASPIQSVLITTGTTSLAGRNNWRDITLDLYRNAGPRSLWRGASPVIVAAPIQNALLMGGYGFGSRWFSGSNVDSETPSLSRSKQLGAIFVGGCTGGILQSFLMSPVELVKVAQQCSSNKNGYAMISAIQNITTNRTVMSGLNATLLRDGIPHGVWFVAYDVSKVTLMSYRYNNDVLQTAINVEDNIPVSVSLTSGAVAATVAWAVGYPADLIKTRIQASSTLGGKPMGIAETARILIQEADNNVLNGLYRGFGMKLIRSIPASMIGFTVYESVKECILRQYSGTVV